MKSERKNEIILIAKFTTFLSIVTLIIMYYFFKEVSIEDFTNFLEFAIDKPGKITLIFAPVVIIINATVCGAFMISRSSQQYLSEPNKVITKKKTTKKNISKK